MGLRALEWDSRCSLGEGLSWRTVAGGRGEVRLILKGLKETPRGRRKTSQLRDDCCACAGESRGWCWVHSARQLRLRVQVEHKGDFPSDFL